MLATAPGLFLAEATAADFERFAARHGWRYESADEHARRFRAFRDNARFIDAHNARADVSFRLGMNLWGDRTLDEIGALGRGPESAAAMLQVATSALIAAGERVPTRQRPPLVGKGTDGGKGGGKDAKRARVKIAPNANRDLSSKEDEDPEIPPVELYLPSDAPPPPETLDWREKGVTSDVYNQGECGACYAIVTAGAVEAAAAIGSGAALVPLSPQSIVDCSGNVSQARDVIDSGNHGCIGGGIVRRWRSPLPALAGPARCSPRAAACSFNYVLKNGGVVSEEAYPSHLDEAPPANCSFSRADVAGAIGAYVNVSANATLLAYALAQVTRDDRAPHRSLHPQRARIASRHVSPTRAPSTCQNPVATSVHAHERSFLFYESVRRDAAEIVPRSRRGGARDLHPRPARRAQGVYVSERCPAEVTHGVLLVGVGEERGRRYWTLKNSWSEFWGEGGYMRIAREPAGMCGLGTEAYYPLLRNAGGAPAATAGTPTRSADASTSAGVEGLAASLRGSGVDNDAATRWRASATTTSR